MPKRPALQVVEPLPVRLLHLKITLLYVKPAIWRRVAVPSSFTLQELHGVIQVAMGWESIHSCQFVIDGIYVGAADVSLTGFRTGLRCFYEYDMGDIWKHEVLVEDDREAEPGKYYPVCTGGENPCPPENCGGPEEYMERLNEAMGFGVIDDLETMADAVKEVLLNGNRDFLENKDMRARLKHALRRTEARQPFWHREFSLWETNARFYKNEHRVLMCPQS